MKNIKLILLPISFILFLECNSCKKDTSVTGPINISGTATDVTTNKPVPIAEVDLIEQDAGSIFGGGSSKTLQHMYADSNGKFAFNNVNINSDKNYIVLGYSKLYFNDGNNTVYVDTKNSSNVIVPMQPMAWLKLHVKDTAPFDKYDKIDFNSPGGGAGPFGGQNVDTFFYAQVYGNVNTRIVAFITKNNNTNIINKYLICPAFDTTLYNFYY